MYNLLVSGEENAWKGRMYSMPKERCVQSDEYTSVAIAERLGTFTEKAINELKSLPCIFAYEDFHEPPQFGWLTNIKERSGSVVLEYRIEQVNPWINTDEFRSLAPVLDIIGWESSRTHWAVKDVNLTEELKPYGIILPTGLNKVVPIVSPDQINFDVAFSFPGESRSYVEAVLKELKRLMPHSPIFYDFDYQAFLARPGLDIYLGNIYRNKSKLLVVFLSADYQRKQWCGLEWRVIREAIFNREHDRVMLIKTDNGEVEGVLSTDGYIDANKHTPQQIAYFIYQRVQLLKQS
jgi:hypothetical protein